MTARQTMTEALKDARAKAIYHTDYAALTAAQRQHVDELMARSTKYAKAGK